MEEKLARRCEGFWCGGLLAFAVGAMFLADCIGCGRAYGYCWGSVVEFAIGTVVLVSGVWAVYLSGVYRDMLAEERRRLWRDELARRREERARRYRRI
ncbi:MAG: hypothetical protein Q4B30_07755 [Coriobacteriaceae bacterium]|nr:hypothetical protein [Coriobacteriaceae bacterium]